MRTIDKQTWYRRSHFEFFETFHNPHFNLSANVDLTVFFPYVKQAGCSVNLAIIYLVARTANSIPEFRQRIRSDEIVEHEVIHPSSTVMGRENLFSFCTFDLSPNFDQFEAHAGEIVEQMKVNPEVENVPRDDLFYMTALPWVAFTAMIHPVLSIPVDSIPRFAWGKIFEEGDRKKMPLGVQAHHGLVDGLHVGMFFERIQENLDNPGSILD